MSDDRRFRVLVVDDEVPARELVRRYVGARRELELVGEAGDGETATALIERTRPDIVLLDIEMPGQDGFGVLLELARRGLAQPEVVFVTAFDRYAVRAFEVNAVDYLLKPVVAHRFNEAIERCIRRAQEGAVIDATRLLEDLLRLPPTRVLAHDRGRIVPVPVEAIRWIEAEGDYVRIHAADRTHLIERTLAEMERILAPLGFKRVHRGAIVNMKAVSELMSEGSGRYRLVLAGGETLTVSRSYSAQFRGTVL